MRGTVTSGPRVLVVKIDSQDAPKPGQGGGPRGVVKGLSKASGRALMTELAFMFWPMGWLRHGTFTYPAEFPTDQGTVKRHLNTLVQRLIRAGFHGFWRLEWQERGAPHFHILGAIPSMDPHQVEIDLRSVGEWWASYTRNSTSYGCNWRPADDGAAWYLSCHQAKSNYQNCWPSWYRGRAWGYINRAQVEEWQDKKLLVSSGPDSISESEMIWLRRIRRRFIQSRTGRKIRLNANAGCKWFLPERLHVPILEMCSDLGALRDRQYSGEFTRPDGTVLVRVGVK